MMSARASRRPALRRSHRTESEHHPLVPRTDRKPRLHFWGEKGHLARPVRCLNIPGGWKMVRSAKQKSTGTKRTGSGAAGSRSNGSSTKSRSRRVAFVVCLDNTGYDASLDVRKIYRVVSDAKADKLGLVRVVDESGEDYLYPERLFAPIEVSPAIRRRLDM